MTEKERMLAGKLYIHRSEELRVMSRKCRSLIYRFNSSAWDKSEERNDILKELLGKIGQNYSILQRFYCCYGKNIYVGNNFFANIDCSFLDINKIVIGDNVLIGPRVMLLTATHPTDYEVRRKHLEYGLPITIGNDVWIGGGTIINPGITIGDRTIIGSGSVVTKDIPRDVIAVGNPCHVIRKISDEERKKWQDIANDYFKEIDYD